MRFEGDRLDLEPRLEQFIRATRAAELGLVRALVDDGLRDPRTMATALRDLPQQARPSEAVIPGLLDGRENLVRLASRALSRRRQRIYVARSAGSRKAGGRS